VVHKCIDTGDVENTFKAHAEAQRYKEFEALFFYLE
jgi:hypothetical protein